MTTSTERTPRNVEVTWPGRAFRSSSQRTTTSCAWAGRRRHTIGDVAHAPIDEAGTLADQLAVTWHDRLELFTRNRLRELGIPEHQIGALDREFDSRLAAFHPKECTGGGVSPGARINLKSGVLNPELLVPHPSPSVSFADHRARRAFRNRGRRAAGSPGSPLLKSPAVDSDAQPSLPADPHLRLRARGLSNVFRTTRVLAGHGNLTRRPGSHRALDSRECPGCWRAELPGLLTRPHHHLAIAAWSGRV